MATIDLKQDAQLESELLRLFPLPLTVLESFMLGEVREGYPVLCDLEADFQGCLDRAAFDGGLAFALARNPLLRSLVENRSLDGRRKSQQVWVPTVRMPHVDWAPAGTPFDERYDTTLDLAIEPGLRVFARPGQQRSTIRFQFHHACCDGVGSFGFVEDFLAGYALAFGSRNDEVVPRALNPDRLLQRGEAGVVPRSLYRRLTDPFVGVREGLRFFMQAPLPLVQGPESAAQSSGARPHRGFLSEILQNDTTRALRRVATTAHVNLNDLLLRDLFVTLCRWNLEHGRQPDNRQLRVLMPQNLRVREDLAMPAANAMSFSFLTRTAGSCRRPDELLSSIRAETEMIRDGKLSLFFLGSLTSLRSVGMLGWLSKRDNCFSTAVLSNVGDPSRRFGGRFPRCDTGLAIGNVIIEGILGTPPLRPHTRATFCVGNRTRRMNICMRADPRYFSAADAESLLGAYVNQLIATAQGAGDSEQSTRETD